MRFALFVLGGAAWWYSGYRIFCEAWLLTWDLRESDRRFFIVLGVAGPVFAGLIYWMDWIGTRPRNDWVVRSRKARP